MVSFRYHVVTIVAVFLALGLGILMGTTVIKQSVVDELQTRTNSASKTADQLRKDIAELRSQLRTWEAFAPQAQHVMIDGQLDGRTVVIVTADRVDFGEIDGARQALSDAGASVSGVVVLSSRLRLEDESARTQLADVLGLPDSSDPADLAREAAEAIAVRLSQGAPLDGGAPDLLEALSGAQLVSVREPADGLQGIGGSDQPVVVLSGGTGEPATDPETFLVPLMESLVQSGHLAVVGETTESEYDVIGPLRSDGALDGGLVTVDNADSMMGRVALVLGLRRMLDSGIDGCADFGVKAGACAMIPAPTPTP